MDTLLLQVPTNTVQTWEKHVTSMLVTSYVKSRKNTDIILILGKSVPVQYLSTVPVDIYLAI